MKKDGKEQLPAEKGLSMNSFVILAIMNVVEFLLLVPILIIVFLDKDKKLSDQDQVTITETEEGPVPLRCEDGTM